MKKNNKYHKDYPELLLQHMEGGSSYESFGAVVGVTEETLNAWCERYPDFKFAKDLGKRHELLYWENLLKKGAVGELPPIKKRVTVFEGEEKKIKTITIIDEPGKFNATAVIFALKNKFPRLYREKLEIQSSSDDPLDQLTDEEVKRRKELYASILKKKQG